MSLEVSPTGRRAIIGSVAAGLAIAVLAWQWWKAPPQIGSDQEVVDAVDALFTAITSRDAARLARCEEKLHRLRDSGRLPRAASTSLDRVIRTARSGRWRNAAETLYAFMKAQRRAKVS